MCVFAPVSLATTNGCQPHALLFASGFMRVLGKLCKEEPLTAKPSSQSPNLKLSDDQHDDIQILGLGAFLIFRLGIVHH